MTEVPPNAQLPQARVQFDMRLSFRTNKEIKQACTRYGASSPYTTGLIQGLALGPERLIPYNWEMIARTCLSTSEFLQSRTWWQVEASQQAQRNTVTNLLLNITVEQSVGQGVSRGSETTTIR